jgi:hypothetical protein
MSTRGRPSHSQIRRLRAPPPKARAPAKVESAETPLADANELIASFRVRAYSEARRRQREAGASEAAAHWSQVSNLIARHSGERRGDASSARTDLERDVIDGGALGARADAECFEIDPVYELERVLAVRPQRFRLEFFGVGADHGPTVLTESEIEAPDASGAIREAVMANWPPRAVGLRLLDLEGREIFERLKADLR